MGRLARLDRGGRDGRGEGRGLFLILMRMLFQKFVCCNIGVRILRAESLRVLLVVRREEGGSRGNGVIGIVDMNASREGRTGRRGCLCHMFFICFRCFLFIFLLTNTLALLLLVWVTSLIRSRERTERTNRDRRGREEYRARAMMRAYYCRLIE